MKIIRKKHLQVVRLLSNDKILKEFNESVPMDDFLDRVRDFPEFWQESIEDDYYYSYFKKFYWLKVFQANFSEVLARSGFCYTFNLPNASEIYNLNE